MTIEAEPCPYRLVDHPLRSLRGMIAQGRDRVRITLNTLSGKGQTTLWKDIDR